MTAATADEVLARQVAKQLEAQTGQKQPELTSSDVMKVAVQSAPLWLKRIGQDAEAIKEHLRIELEDSTLGPLRDSRGTDGRPDERNQVQVILKAMRGAIYNCVPMPPHLVTHISYATHDKSSR